MGKEERIVGWKIYFGFSKVCLFKQNVYGFFKLSLVCSKTNVDFFITPIQLKNGKTAKIMAEPLRLTKSIVNDNDECYIIGSFQTEKGSEIIGEKSNIFDIISDFDVGIYVENDIFKPGEKIIIG